MAKEYESASCKTQEQRDWSMPARDIPAFEGDPFQLPSCQHKDPEHGYIVSKALLQEHFGNDYKIAMAYIKKALAWPTIKSEDAKSLQAYALFLRGCCSAMEELHHMQESNMPSNMKTVVSKLPYKLRERWRVVAHDIVEAYDRRALLMWLYFWRST